MDLSILRRTAAEIAAAAVYEMYPDVELWGGGETSTGFFYEFYFPHPIHPQLIEEKMRQIVRERRPIRTLEMVPFSACELLKAEGHLGRAEEIESVGGLVEVIQIGTFHDLSPGPHLKNSAELAAFKISAEPMAEKGMRIIGWCHTSKDLLKEFLKKMKHYVEPTQMGEAMGFWKGDVWLPNGIEARHLLIEYLKKEWFQDAYEIFAPKTIDHKQLHRTFNKPKVAEIYINETGETQILISLFGKFEGEVISSLQSIGKTLTILGFDHFTVPKGPVTDYVVIDGLDRNVTLVRVEKVETGIIITAGIETIFSLLLDKRVLQKTPLLEKQKNLILQMVNIENQ